MVAWSFARVFRETVFGHLFHCPEEAVQLSLPTFSSMVYVAFFHFGVQSVSCYLLRLFVCNAFVHMVNVKSDSVCNLVRPELIFFFAISHLVPVTG